MKLTQSPKIFGTYKFFSIDKKTKYKKMIGFRKNIITNTCLNNTALSFIGTYPTDNIIKYCAVGTDNTAVAATDTTLGAEVHRSPYVARSNPTNGVVTIDFYITDTGVTTIEEVGIFGGNTASQYSDTGVLISHVLWDYDKSSSEELLIQYTITISQ